MRRRDEAVGKAIKTQRRKTLKRRNTAKAARRRKASVDANERIAQLTRERDEAQERQTATTLYRAMKESAGRIRAGEAIAPAMARGAEMIKAAGFELDYFEARHAATLAPATSRKDGALRILVAAKLGTTRLIDNIAV